VKIIATTSPAGLKEVEIQVSPGEREDGLALLERLFPVLRDFDRFIRERGQEGRNPEGR
jgi:hypothetical protein